MSSIGRIIGRHRVNAGLSVATTLFGLLLLGCAVLLFAIKDKANPEGAALLGRTMIGGGLIGAGLVLAGVLLRRRAWLVGELGVQGPARHGTETWMYGGIAETCQFYRSGMSVGLAWRKHGADEWGAVNAHLSGYRRFADTLLQGYLQHRVPALLHEIERGHTVSFRLLSAAGYAQKQFALGIRSYLNADTVPVRLSRFTLSLPGQDVAIASIHALDMSAWTERLSIRLHDGSSVSVSYTGLFDGPLLLALLDQLIAAGRQQAA
jgi:hypothetical protein